MKNSLLLLLSVIAIGVSSARADVSVDVFYDSLDPYGDWIEVADYGYCWTPRDVDADWRPYTDGEWAHTDAGWTWVSEEPYGWAVYHYGRWLRTNTAGWVWVPGEEWGPAWVSWRRSPEYVGWAPLPPEVRFSASVQVSSQVDVEFDIGPAYYSFVNVRHFGARRLRPVIIEPTRNVTIINQTRNITNITYVNQTVINRGPDYEVMTRESESPIRQLKLNRRTDFGGQERLISGGAKISGDTLQLPAPRIEKRQGAKPKKVAKRIEKEQINRGWKDAGSEEEIQKVRAKMKQEQQEPAPAETVTKTTPEAAPKGEVKPEMKANRKPEEPADAGKPAKVEQPAAEEKPGKTDKPATENGKPGNAEKPDAAEKATVAEKPDAAKKPDTKPDKSGKTDRRGKDDKEAAAESTEKKPENDRPAKPGTAAEKRAPAEKPEERAMPKKIAPDQERERPDRETPARKPMNKEKADEPSSAPPQRKKPRPTEPAREEAQAPVKAVAKPEPPRREAASPPKEAPQREKKPKPEKVPDAAKPSKAADEETEEKGKGDKREKKDK